jgi:hypothetical protein
MQQHGDSQSLLLTNIGQIEFDWVFVAHKQARARSL